MLTDHQAKLVKQHFDMYTYTFPHDGKFMFNPHEIQKGMCYLIDAFEKMNKEMGA